MAFGIWQFVFIVLQLEQPSTRRSEQPSRVLAGNNALIISQAKADSQGGYGGATDSTVAYLFVQHDRRQGWVFGLLPWPVNTQCHSPQMNESWPQSGRQAAATAAATDDVDVDADAQPGRWASTRKRF